ncbi:trehalase family glycosidase [Arthrobacter sp. LAPM80]|uniref:amylo-alpha-1,6-glucosidase n=1 Tax=Arthrobacter sp. LAPM80 TaxID=3141788 RepID=UPI00398B7A89
MSAWPGAGAFLDLDAVPLTDRGSRLLIFARPDGSLRVAGAVYERHADRCTHLRRLAVEDADGRQLPVTGVGPEGISFSDGAVSLTFVDAETLSLGVADEGPLVRVVLEAFGTDELGQPISEADGAPIRWCSTQGRATFGAPSIVLPAGGSVSVRMGGAVRATPEPGSHGRYVEAASGRWRDWFDKLPAVRDSDREMARYAWWLLASNIVRLATHPDLETVVPSKQGYVAAWQWDSYFISFGLRHGDPKLAADQLRLFFAEQAPDGGLPDVVHDGGTLACVADMPPGDLVALARIHGPDSPMVTQAYMPITKPPLAAWAARAVDQAAGSSLQDSVQAELKGGLDRLHRWWFDRPSPDGLPGYEHVYSSGLDDSPLFDDGGPVFAPDLPSYLVMALDSMAALADDCGDVEEAGAQRSMADATADLLVAERYDAGLGQFVALTPAGRRETLTPFALMPLLTGRLSTQVLESLRESLTAPGALGAAYPLPTVALGEPEFDADKMWRGPVWLNVNWLVVQGLQRSGMDAEAADLAERTVHMVRESGGIHEYWNPLTGARAAGATTGFGWSAALFLDLAVWLASRRK